MPFRREESTSVGSAPWRIVREHAEYAQLSEGKCWKFHAGSMARMASGSVVLSTDADNAILGVVVSKTTEKLVDEEEIIREFEGEPSKESGTVDQNQSLAHQNKDETSFYGDDIASNGTSKSTKEAQQKRIEDDEGTSKKEITQYSLNFTVDFRQSAAALGRIPMNYFRRELSHTDQDIAIARVLDRSLRPTIHPHFSGRTHIVCKPLSLDENGDASVMGINVASAALAISPVPQQCVIAAARVAIIDGKIVVNPMREMLKHSTLDLVLAGTTVNTDSGNRVIMVEMDGAEVERDKFVECMHQGFTEIAITQHAIQKLANTVGQPKYKLDADNNEFGQELLERVALCEGALEAIFSDHNHDKQSRGMAIEEVFQGWYVLTRRVPPYYSEAIFRAIYADYVKKIHRRVVIETGRRIDGRQADDFRPIECRVDLYRKLHGSSMFQRGQSQVMSTVTFDSPQAAFHPDAIAQLLGAQRKKCFMLHYEFPQFAVNEVDASGGMYNRREVGHGLLAEKALRRVMPDEFPYTIRLACQVLESNGSTSMASVCAGSMALYDAGVPLLANHVAGLAIGLLTDEQHQQQTRKQTEHEKSVNSSSSIANITLPEFPNNYLLLTDLAGFEDYSGDMDFKIAGTSKGFTAMQMDLKICGLPTKIFCEALQRAQTGLEHVLALMRAIIPEPRSEFKSSVPIIELMQMPLYKRPILFRSGAYNAKLIEAETGVKINSDDDTNISLFAPNKQCMERAKEIITKLLEEQQDDNYQFGAIFKAEIVRILDNGLYVTLKEGGRPIWIRNADLSSSPSRQNALALGLEVGQFIQVQYFGRDQHSGQHRLTRKTLLIQQPPVQNLFRAKEELMRQQQQSHEINSTEARETKERNSTKKLVNGSKK